MAKKSWIRRTIHAASVRPHLLIATVIGITIFIFSPSHWRNATSALVAWDVATLAYLVFLFRLAQDSPPDRIRVLAKLQDNGAVMTLLLSCLAAIMSFVAIAFELSATKSMTGPDRYYHFLLVGITIPLAWTFIHAMFALHYAHEFYEENGGNNGLIFPGDDPPTYWDFIYFSLIIGTSGQTADVTISSTSMRNLATVHCVLAFFFNITMMGLTINVASSLF